MWKIFTRLLMKKDKKEDGQTMKDAPVEDKNESQVPSAPKKRKHKLEIQVYEADYTDVPDGSPPKWRPVRSDPTLGGGGPIVIEVADKNELNEIQQRYALCEQKIKIIREIDPFDDNESIQVAHDIPQKNKAIPVQQENAVEEASYASKRHAIVEHAAPAQKPKPKIITIGDMQVKYDGDKVYQKQWVKLNANEAANFRVVNDSNNKIVTLNGKHIECRKWVIVEEDVDETDDVMSEIGD